MAGKIRVAFVKFGGLTIGGTELWLQIMANDLPKDEFEVDYYYCDAAPYIGSDYKHADTHPERLAFMQKSGARLIKFHVKAKDVTTSTHDWIGTDFWDVFDGSRYDIVQTGRAGQKEYPFHLIDRPVVEFVGLARAGVDPSPNIAWTIHCSHWQWGEWYRRGGRLERVSVIPNPAREPCTTDDFRRELGIAPDHVVAGMIQRADNHLFSPIPLSSFKNVMRPDRHFVLMAGGSRYKEQAQALGLRNVHFLPPSGADAVVSKFFNTLDFFAHGRRDGETYGTVFAEALAHGKPCLSHYVADGNNGQEETIGPCGFFARTPHDYTLAMDLLFSDVPLRAKLASKARRHAAEHYSRKRGMDDLAAIYRRVAGRPARSEDVRSLPYALSPLGFNYAGPIGTPGALANHTITGDIPEEADVNLVRFFIPQIRTFLDVGANTGLYGFVAAHGGPPDLRAAFFEPQADCRAALEKTIGLNNWEERLTVIPVALGDRTGDATLHLSGTGSTLAPEFLGNTPSPTVSVRQDTLDRQVEALQWPRVEFIKIDVEGGELAVLRGAQETLRRHHPVLFVEIADHLRSRAYRNPHYADTLTLLADAGYRVWRCTDDGRLIDAFPVRSQENIAMYIALHGTAHAAWIAPMQAWMRRYRAHRRMKRVRKLARLFLRSVRHPRQAYGAFRAYRRNPGGGVRF